MLKLNKIRQLLAFSVILAGAVVTVLIALKFHRPKEPVAVLEALPRNIDLSLQKIRYTEMRKGARLWELLADRVDYDRSRDITRFTGIRMVISGETKSGDCTLTAERADYHNGSGDVSLSGNVVARNAGGLSFTSGRVSYLADRSLLTSDDRVKIVDGRLTVEGTGMEFPLKTKNLRIIRSVNATLGPRGR